jgi:uncharacterized protein YbjT (DUF2867 family)
VKVLMVGATGKYASLVLPELKQQGVTVRALVRDKDKATAAQQRGVDETAIADLRDPDSLRAAASGVDGVFHINPALAPDEAKMGVTMVEAAKAAGVRKFVFSGVIHPSLSKLSNHTAKCPVEEALYESGMEFTVLQPTRFMQQNLERDWDTVLAQGHFSLPYSKHLKGSYVDYRDVAEVAALALTGDKLSYGTFELSAPGMFSRMDIVATIGKTIGRTIEAGELPFDEWVQAARIPEGHLREGFRQLYAHYDRYDFLGNPLVLRAILGREPRTMQEYIQDLANRKATPRSQTDVVHPLM